MPRLAETIVTRLERYRWRRVMSYCVHHSRHRRQAMRARGWVTRAHLPVLWSKVRLASGFDGLIRGENSGRVGG